MDIILNGTAREIPDQTSAADLLDSLGLAGKRLALEVNREIVPRSRFEQHLIRPGDRVEIVQAIGGG
jgi:thiamine biosynthesis protein ThiS